MSNDLTVSTNNQLITIPTGIDPFAAAAKMSSTQILLPGSVILKFVKDEYVVGQKADPLKVGTKCTAAMDLYQCGWFKWLGKRPVDHIMATISKGYAPPARAALGDTDESKWEVSDRGEVRDPWQFTHHLPLYDLDAKAFYTFVSTSHGGRSAIGTLCKIYADGRKRRPDDFPIVSLEVGAYAHREFKRVKVPELKLAGWAPKAQFYDAVGLTPDGEVAGCDTAAPDAQAEPDTVDDEVPF
jgi:hypothetical protein